MNISEYFIGKVGEVRSFFDDKGTLVTSYAWSPEGSDSEGRQLWGVYQQNSVGSVISIWKMRVEADGSLTEYADVYPRTSMLDWPAKQTTLHFVEGYAIRWGEDVHGTCRPNPLKTSRSKLASFGTYLCKTMPLADGSVSIYIERNFAQTERELWMCRKGYGPYGITFYTETGATSTVYAEGQKPAPKAP